MPTREKDRIGRRTQARLPAPNKGSKPKGKSKDNRFGHWQVQGYNFSYRTVYVDPDKLRPCPSTYKEAQADSNFEEYKGLGWEFLGEIGERLFHGGAELVKEVGKMGGFQQECAYDEVGNLANEVFDATPNEHADALYHTFDDHGGPLKGLLGLSMSRALNRFFIDMHVDERLQLAYFVFVASGRKPLHEALIAASENPHNLALWEKVAALYNGPKHAERSYGPDLQKYFFEYESNSSNTSEWIMNLGR